MKSLLSSLSLMLAFSFSLSAAEVRITGVDAKQQKNYRQRLEPRLQFINSRPASSWRADDASFYLSRLFIRDGYPLADVSWTISGNTIILNVTSGKRYFYGGVSTFEPVSLDAETLRDYFFQPLVESEFVSIDKAPYIHEYSEKGATNLENFLKSQGYWHATVALFSETLNKENGRVDILLDVVEADLHTLAQPQLIGIPSESQQEILASLKKVIGKTATSENINTVNSEVTSYFRRKGFHFAKIETRAEHVNSKTLLTFTINQGQRYRVNKLIVRGNSATKKRRISRHFDHLKKEVYNAEESDKATRKLLNTGVFERVTVTPLTKENGMLDLDIEVKEGDTITTQTYIGADSYEGAIIGLSYRDLNFVDKMWQFNARGEYSGRGLLGEVGVTEPFFAGEDISFNTRLFALSRRPDGYNSHEFGVDASWEWTANDSYSMRLFTTGSFISTDSASLTPAELGTDDYVSLRIGLTQHLDLRNDPILPNKGYHGKLTTEFSTIEGSDSSSYFRAEINNSYRQPIDSRSYITSRFNAGITSAQTSLPIDRRFFTGGSNTVRSFPERGLGPQSASGDPIGGESYWIGSVEYIRKIKGPFHLSSFYDVGQVYPADTGFSFANPSQAIGLGARIHLPIGPVRFEYGYNLNRKEHEPAGTFHFSIGASF